MVEGCHGYGGLSAWESEVSTSGEGRVEAGGEIVVAEAQEVATTC